MRSRSVAWRAYTTKAMATAINSNAVKGKTRRTPMDQKKPATVKDITHKSPYMAPSWPGVTEQLRLKHHSRVSPW